MSSIINYDTNNIRVVRDDNNVNFYSKENLTVSGLNGSVIITEGTNTVEQLPFTLITSPSYPTLDQYVVAVRGYIDEYVAPRAYETFIGVKDYTLEVAKGNVEDTGLITKFGFNDVISTGTTPEDVINQGGAFVAPTAARIHNILSTSVNDTSGGTGMRSVLIFGVLDDYSRQTETVILNGTSNVPTVYAYRHIHLMQNQTSGNGTVNAGTITATAQTDGTITCQINIGEGQSASSVYLVPLGYTAYILRTRARMNCSTANSSAIVGLYTIPFGKGLQLKTRMGLNNTGTSFVALDYTSSSPFIVPEKSWIRMRCTNVSNNNTVVESEYDLNIVYNG